MIRWTPMLALPLLLSGCVIHLDGSSCQSADYQTEEVLLLSASDLRRFEVKADAGQLLIFGEPGRSEISVEATLYSTGPEAEDHDFRLERRGDTAVLTATQHSTMGCWRDSPRIDLVVKAPAGLDLTVDDGSGDLEILGMTGALSVEDGSGNLVIDGGSRLVLDDGSGDARVRNVTGSATIEDGSGNLWVSRIGGDLEVDDGSGDLAIVEVAGAARIEDGSGNLSVEKVDGVVTVDDGSGDIRVRHVGGFTLVEGGSGQLSLKEVTGPVSLN
ncbi:DUF4097 family beta strand repeat-containing protein [Ferrimonas balearica]|uniref:DUF4097 family beta strand repeat-containing protein n=1 Tax=Ferrimonas balearica TaxID=44012 RepID=UPI001C99F4A1|nr:hypothetical protein [Ferrimonas balearica]MBY5992442.1 hypothetical protein [Ferrimonas balearica]